MCYRNVEAKICNVKSSISRPFDYPLVKAMFAHGVLACNNLFVGCSHWGVIFLWTYLVYPCKQKPSISLNSNCGIKNSEMAIDF